MPRVVRLALGRGEVRTVFGFDQPPAERRRRDIPPSAELTQQVNHPIGRQTVCHVVEQRRWLDPQLLGDDVVDRRADHPIASIRRCDDSRQRGREQRVAKSFRGALSKSNRGLPETVPTKVEPNTVI
jgi:hypothetical protein